MELNIHSVALIRDTKAYKTETLDSFLDHDLKVTTAMSYTMDDVYRFVNRSVQGSSFAILVALKTISAWVRYCILRRHDVIRDIYQRISKYRLLSIKLGLL